MIEGTPTIAPEFTSAMSELGIDPTAVDDGSIEFEAPESTEAEGEAPIEAETESEESDAPELQEEPSPEGEEKAENQPEVVEEPKLTAKEFREIEEAKAKLNAERETFQKELEAREKEFQTKYQEKLETHDQIDAFFAHLEAKDPELFELLKGEFQEHQKQYSNPVLDQTRKEIAELKKQLGQFTAKASDEVTLTKMEAEKNQVMATLGKEAEKVGLKVDLSKVEDLWAKGLSFEQAFNAVHGTALRQASLSKAKVDIAEKKVAARPSVPTAGSVKRSAAPVQKDFSKMGTRDVVGYFAQQIAGKKV